MRNGVSNPLNDLETYLRIRAGQYSTTNAHSEEEGTWRRQKNTVGLCIPRLLELQTVL